MDKNTYVSNPDQGRLRLVGVRLPEAMIENLRFIAGEHRYRYPRVSIQNLIRDAVQSYLDNTPPRKKEISKPTLKSRRYEAARRRN